MINKIVKTIVINYLKKMYLETEDSMLKGSITKVLQKI